MTGPRVRPSASESDRDDCERTPPSGPTRRETRSHDSRHRDRERDKKRDKKVTPARRWQRTFLAILFVCTTTGSVASFWLLPKGAVGSDSAKRARGVGFGTSGASRVRMVHLSLANSNRRARFVLDETTVWESFLAGCRDRLQVSNILKVTDSSGETILAVEVSTRFCRS